MSVQAESAARPGATIPLGKGLEDVVAGVSSITEVRGREGRLFYRGYDIHDLARRSTFEETTYLLWHNDLPRRDQLEEFTASLMRARDLPEPEWSVLADMPREGNLMDALRTAVSLLALYNPDAGDTSDEASCRQSIALTARMATLVANLARHREGKEPVRPPQGKRLAESFLAMCFGREPATRGGTRSRAAWRKW